MKNPTKIKGIFFAKNLSFISLAFLGIFLIGLFGSIRFKQEKKKIEAMALKILEKKPTDCNNME